MTQTKFNKLLKRKPKKFKSITHCKIHYSKCFVLNFFKTIKENVGKSLIDPKLGLTYLNIIVLKINQGH